MVVAGEPMVELLDLKLHLGNGNVHADAAGASDGILLLLQLRERLLAIIGSLEEVDALQSSELFH